MNEQLIAIKLFLVLKVACLEYFSEHFYKNTKYMLSDGPRDSETETLMGLETPKQKLTSLDTPKLILMGLETTKQILMFLQTQKLIVMALETPKLILQ